MLLRAEKIYCMYISLRLEIFMYIQYMYIPILSASSSLCSKSVLRLKSILIRPRVHFLCAQIECKSQGWTAGPWSRTRASLRSSTAPWEGESIGYISGPLGSMRYRLANISPLCPAHIKTHTHKQPHNSIFSSLQTQTKRECCRQKEQCECT